MSRRYLVLGFLGAALLVSSAAQAEMIEIKNKGFVNGTVLSEDEKYVEFKGTDGLPQKILKSDITFREKEVPVAPIKKPLFELPKAPPKKIATKKEPAGDTAKKSALGGYLTGLAGSVRENQQKMDMETQYALHSKEMSEHQWDIIRQARGAGVGSANVGRGSSDSSEDSSFSSDRQDNSSSKGRFDSL